jgi:hypothetical protein
MRRWEIYEAELPPGWKHPVVVFSPNSVCAEDGIKWINVLLCSTVRLGDSLSSSEVGLDAADGLTNLTGCQCHMLWHISKSRLMIKLGEVSHERRIHIKQKFRTAFEF